MPRHRRLPNVTVDTAFSDVVYPYNLLWFSMSCMSYTRNHSGELHSRYLTFSLCKRSGVDPFLENGQEGRDHKGRIVEATIEMDSNLMTHLVPLI